MSAPAAQGPSLASAASIHFPSPFASTELNAKERAARVPLLRTLGEELRGKSPTDSTILERVRDLFQQHISTYFQSGHYNPALNGIRDCLSLSTHATYPSASAPVANYHDIMGPFLFPYRDSCRNIGDVIDWMVATVKEVSRLIPQKAEDRTYFTLRSSVWRLYTLIEASDFLRPLAEFCEKGPQLEEALASTSQVVEEACIKLIIDSHQAHSRVTISDTRSSDNLLRRLRAVVPAQHPLSPQIDEAISAIIQRMQEIGLPRLREELPALEQLILDPEKVLDNHEQTCKILRLEEISTALFRERDPEGLRGRQEIVSRRIREILGERIEQEVQLLEQLLKNLSMQPKSYENLLASPTCLGYFFARFGDLFQGPRFERGKALDQWTETHENLNRLASKVLSECSELANIQPRPIPDSDLQILPLRIANLEREITRLGSLEPGPFDFLGKAKEVLAKGKETLGELRQRLETQRSAAGSAEAPPNE